MTTRSLLPLVLVVPFLAATLLADEKSDKEQAIAEIKKLKGVVVGQGPDSISFDGKKITDDDLVHLKKLPDITGLFLRRCKITDKGLESLAGLTKLKFLYLTGTEVTDKGLESLKGLTKLEALNLEGTQVTDEGLALLKDLSALRTLELKGTKVTDAGVKELKKLLPNVGVRK